MFFKKKETGEYVIVDFSYEAKDKSLGYDFLKKIYYYYNGRVYKIEDYSEVKLKELKRYGYFIHNKTEGMQIPKESQFIPVTSDIMGTIQITKRVW